LGIAREECIGARPALSGVGGVLQFGEGVAFGFGFGAAGESCGTAVTEVGGVDLLGE
jgi:hypothetical protein